MFFEQFPFQDRDEGLCDEFVAICAVYVMLRVLCVCAMAGQSEQTVFVDAMAATFRFIDIPRSTDMVRTCSKRLAAPTKRGWPSWLRCKRGIKRKHTEFGKELLGR